MPTSIEIAGILLIIIGTIYIFLKALDILKGKEESEIESKIFTLKGGPGIVLVGLGVLLLLIGAAIEPPDQTPIEPSNVKISPVFLNGKWSTGDKNLKITFNLDGTFTLENIGESTFFKGKYRITDSKLLLSYEDGAQGAYSDVYIDDNTISLESTVYSRILIEETPTNGLPPDYLIGKWIKSDRVFKIQFFSDGSFLAEDASDLTSFTGTYTLTDSKIQLTTESGTSMPTSIIYIDINTFKMGDAVYIRDITVSPGITNEYLVGEWSTVASDWAEVTIFSADGNFVVATAYLDTDKVDSSGGSYYVRDSTLILYYDDGTQKSFTLTYVDENSFKIGDSAYKRKI